MIPNSITDRIESIDNRGVSPVIGVILMVAITVILAAVIGTFVLDLGQSAGNSAPSASLAVTTDATANEFEISHKGGDSLVAADSRVIITNETGTEQITIDGGDDPDNFGVGESVVITTDNGLATPESAVISDTWLSMQNSSTTDDLKSESTYSVQLIDTESQRVIFETTVTA